MPETRAGPSSEASWGRRKRSVVIYRLVTCNRHTSDIISVFDATIPRTWKTFTGMKATIKIRGEGKNEVGRRKCWGDESRSLVIGSGRSYVRSGTRARTRALERVSSSSSFTSVSAAPVPVILRRPSTDAA